MLESQAWAWKVRSVPDNSARVANRVVGCGKEEEWCGIVARVEESYGRGECGEEEEWCGGEYDKEDVEGKLV